MADDDRKRLLEHIAHLTIALQDDGYQGHNESWRSLPDHLQDAIISAEAEALAGNTEEGAKNGE